MTSDVIEKDTGKERSETRWYISSLGLNAKQALDSVRSGRKYALELDMTLLKQDDTKQASREAKN